MTDPKATSDEPAAAAADTPKPDGSAVEPSTAAPSSREEALNQLRGDSAERLDTVRSGQILNRGIDRLGLDSRVTHANVFMGDFAVMGDFATGGRPGRSAPRAPARSLISAAHIAEHTECFVEPSAFAEAVELLDTNNLLFVSARRGTGRYTTALALLTRVLGVHGLEPTIYSLTGHVLGNASWRMPATQTGFVVVDDTRGSAKSASESVDDGWLARTGEVLREGGSYLVVITGPLRGSLATASRRDDFVLQHLDVPDPVDIVRRRVRGAIPDLSADDVDQRLAATSLGELLDERDEPRFATRAATAVIDALRADGDLDEALAKLRDPEGQVSEWLGGDPPVQEIAFTLATAVLEESSYLTVSDAAIALHGQLSAGANSSPRYLRALLAERSWIELAGSEDRPQAPRIVRFRHADLRGAVLAQVWYELDGTRPKILEWLGKLVDHADIEVRARAAMAAGILAAGDFQHGLHRYLMPWAAAKSAVRRQSAALALSIVGAFTDHTPKVWSLLEQWADLVRSTSGHATLSATAALAVGGPLGDDDPQRALRLLRTLVCEGDWDLLEPSALSAHLLIERGRQRQVLDALLEWTAGGGTDEPVVKALLVFVVAARESGSPTDNPATDRPALLRTAHLHRESLPELWGRALSCEPVRPLALDALREWVHVVDRVPAAHAVVLDMVAGIADRGAADLERLLHALESWANDEDDPLRSAAEIHDDLVEAEEAIA
ncbi:hypothetical protein [Actinokineospora sp.]|uniref:hypothetical protein n=1 Tax=Actinokineospora sp. TaxID=1872133 RepID=UPI004037AB5D